MNTKFVSIIVPVYNTELYLDKCINSILQNNYKNYELILVDDGSTDESLNKCKQYQKKDDRIKIISKNNTGVSNSRNVALNSAKGEYILFLDSDDYIEKQMIKEMVKSMTSDVEMVICNYSKIYDKHEVLNDMSQYYEKQYSVRDICSNNIYGYCFNKMFRKDIIIKNNVLFKEDLVYQEDMVFLCEYMKNIKKVKILPNSYLYNYVQRNDGGAKTISKKRYNILKYYNNIIKFYDKFSNKSGDMAICKLMFLMKEKKKYKFCIEQNDIILKKKYTQRFMKSYNISLKDKIKYTLF